MPTPEARRGRIGHLYELLAGADSVEELAGDLAHVAADHLDARVSCGLTAHMEGGTVTIAGSDELADQLDKAQDAAGEGPCLTAIATGEIVEVPDPASATQWPAWRRVAVDHGLRRSLSLPLIARGETLGAVNVYSTRADAFSDRERDAARLFATHATGALMVAIRLAHLAELTGHLEAALESRAVIDQAKGVLIAENHCTADEAMAILRKASQNRNTKLREIAAQIVGRAGHANPTADVHSTG